ncbi:hypothetical protein ACFL3D_00600 [Candidatus Omnitrophota bacterium]
MNMFNDEEIPEWEMEEVDVHENLRKKWEKDQQSEKTMKACPQCGKLIMNDSFNCIYCGSVIYSDSGVIGKLGAFVTSWGGGIVFLIVLLMILIYLIV